MAHSKTKTLVLSVRQRPEAERYNRKRSIERFVRLIGVHRKMQNMNHLEKNLTQKIKSIAEELNTSERTIWRDWRALESVYDHLGTYLLDN